MNTLSADVSQFQRACNLLESPFPGLTLSHAGARIRAHLYLACTVRTKPVARARNGTGSAGHEVLVVDDNRDAADSLAQLCGVMGAKVAVAYGAQEALSAMAATRPKIAIIDISMPLMNGYELAAQIRASGGFEDVVLIALTGWDQPGSMASLASTGFDHHLTKPADVHQLTRLLESIQ